MIQIIVHLLILYHVHVCICKLGCEVEQYSSVIGKNT